MTWETSLRCSPRVRALFTGVRGRGILRSPFAGSWIGPRNTQARCPKSSPGRLVYADTTPVIPDDMSVPSPAVLGHLGRGKANFAITEFSEVRLALRTVASCLRWKKLASREASREEGGETSMDFNVK